MRDRILITGASVAGTTAAWWLGRAGLDVTVVERTPGFRDGGQNIDVRGVGREVLRRIGLEQAALDHGTEGTAWSRRTARSPHSSSPPIRVRTDRPPRWQSCAATWPGCAYFTIPREADDDRLWRWYNAPGGRSVSLRPDRHGTARAMLSVQQPPGGEQDWDADRRKAWLRERFADAGWQTGRVLDGMATTDDFYFDVLRQVRMPRWSNGRVALKPYRLQG
ncbi:FAD-dependent monooxygenase [Sphingomonas sp.]|uniref:FAD-dependent monooxygenase n=1 Tax=Sphingomonas sp. TaxID=28214 RepID=UPI003AFFCE5D